MVPIAAKKANSIARPPEIAIAAAAAVRSASSRSGWRLGDERRSGARRSATGGGRKGEGWVVILRSGGYVPFGAIVFLDPAYGKGALSVPHDQEDSGGQQDDTGDPRDRQRPLRETEDPEAVDHDRGCELAGDRRRGRAAGAERPDGDERGGDVRGS